MKKKEPTRSDVIRSLIARGLMLSLEAMAILYVMTNFPFPHLEFVYEGF